MEIPKLEVSDIVNNQSQKNAVHEIATDPQIKKEKKSAPIRKDKDATCDKCKQLNKDCKCNKKECTCGMWILNSNMNTHLLRTIHKTTLAKKTINSNITTEYSTIQSLIEKIDQLEKKLIATDINMSNKLEEVNNELSALKKLKKK